MTSRFSIKSILALSVVCIMSIVSSTAGAWLRSPQSSDQPSCTSLLGCSINLKGALYGLGKIDGALYAAQVAVYEVSLDQVNPSGEAGTAQGTPFIFANGVTFNAEDFITAAEITKRGTADALATVHDAEIIAAIRAAIEQQCDAGDPDACALADTLKTNWIIRVVVTKHAMLVEQVDANGQRVDAIGASCVAPDAVQQNPLDYVGLQFDYICAEQCHDKDNKSTVCPASVTQVPTPNF